MKYKYNTIISNYTPIIALHKPQSSKANGNTNSNVWHTYTYSANSMAFRLLIECQRTVF